MTEIKQCCTNPEHVATIQEAMLDEEVVYDIADFFKVFGDSTRLKILYALLNGEVCVGDLSEALRLNQSAVSHQLRILRQNDLVKFRRDGKTVYYSLGQKNVPDLLNRGLGHIMGENGGSQ